MLPITRPNRTDSRGFTLAEMLLVVVIIAITAAIAVPRYARSFDHMKLRSTALDVAATVEHAQSTAVLEERFLKFTINRDEGTCVIESDSGDTSESPLSPISYELPRGISFHSVEFEDTLLAHRDYLTFRPDGWADRATIRLANKSGETYEISVQRGLGRTQVAESEIVSDEPWVP